MWLPVAQRELLVVSRKPLAFWARLTAPAAGLILLFAAAPELSTSPPPTQGGIVFRYGALALFLFSVIAGFLFTAESISVERHEGTLPILRLTGMREIDFVLGKTLANSLPGIFGFFAATPLLAVAFTLGGVTVAEFARVMGVLFGTLILSLAIGVAASSETESRGAALTLTLTRMLIIFALGLPGLLYVAWQRKAAKSEKSIPARVVSASRWLVVLGVIVVWYFRVPTGSPLLLLLQVLWKAPGLFPSAEIFAVSVVGLYAMAFYFLASARPFTAIAGSSLSNPGVRTLSPLHRRAHLPRGANPFRSFLGATDAEIILATGWAVVGGSMQLMSNAMTYGGGDMIASVAEWVAFFLAAFIYLLFARRAADFIVESRRNGMLEVLLVTPLRWEELLVMQRAAFLRFAWLPCALLMSGEILGMMAAFRFSQFRDRPEFSLSLFLVIVLTYICSLFATLWAAVFFALRTRSPTHAAVYTVLAVLVLPAIAALLFPANSPNFVPTPFLVIMVGAWGYILIDGAIWFLARVWLNRLAAGSPARICDRSAFRE